MFCEIYLHSAAHITTDPRFIYFIEFLDQPVAEKLDRVFLLYGHEVLQVECADSQVQSYPYKHIRDTYVTLGWISTDAFLAPHVNARKF